MTPEEMMKYLNMCADNMPVECNAGQIRALIEYANSLQRQATTKEIQQIHVELFKKNIECYKSIFVEDLKLIGHTEIYDPSEDEDHDCDYERCSSVEHYKRIH